MSALGPDEIGTANWREFAAPSVSPLDWTAVVPAAGRGSRLGFHRPKILCPIAGRMALEWLLDFLMPNCSQLIFVLSPDGENEVAPELERLIPGRFAIVIQDNPTGMGNAVERALPEVKTCNVAVVWGDQVALRPASVDACMRLHQGPLQPAVTCPTVFRANPYIHFERDSSGRISALLQAREGDTMPEQGESDTGFFCFRADALRSLFLLMQGDSGAAGRLTGEANFLPSIPLAVREGLTILTPRLMTLNETIGINTRQDIGSVESSLLNSHAGTDHHTR